MDRKGKMESSAIWPIAIVILAILVLFWGPISEKISPAEVPVTPTEPAISGVGTVCPVDTAALDFKAEDIKYPGTPVTSNATYWVNGISKGVHSTAAATDVTVSPSDKIDVVFAFEAETYYGDYKKEMEMECKGTQTISGTLYKQDSSVSVTIFDPDGDKNGPTVANFTIAAGESPKFDLRLDSGNSKQFFGNPATNANNVLTCVYNYSSYDELILYKDGQVVDTMAASPRIVSDVSGSEKISWEVLRVAGADVSGYQLEVVADDVVNPAADIPCYINDVDFFLNNKNGLVEVGVEDEDDAQTGIASAVSFTLGLA